MDSGIQSTLKSLAKHLLAALVLYFPLVTASASLEFSDQTAISGVAPPFLADIPAGGIAVADFDGNGYPDIFVTGYLLDNRIHFNQGDGTFVENPDINAMVAGNRCSVAAAADYNNDGWPDIYVGCRNQSNLLLKNLEGKGFSNEIVPELDHSATGANSSRTDAVAWGDLTGNGHLDLFIGVYPASSQPDLNDPDNIDRIVLNHGDGTWTNIAEAFTGEARAKSARTTLAVAISDLDHNGQPDIYVVNDKLQGNLLWRNDGAGCGGLCLTERSAQSGVSRPVFGMGIGLGDVDRGMGTLGQCIFSSIDEQVLMRGKAPRTVFRGRYRQRLSTIWRSAGERFSPTSTMMAGKMPSWLSIAAAFSTSSNSDQLFSNQGDGTFVSVISGSGLETIRPTGGSGHHRLRPRWSTGPRSGALEPGSPVTGFIATSRRRLATG